MFTGLSKSLKNLVTGIVSDGTTISTIHCVKGAKFDTVIAFGLLQGYVPHSMDANGDETANRLLYVVGSRARKNLHLISEVGRKNWKK